MKFIQENIHEFAKYNKELKKIKKNALNRIKKHQDINGQSQSYVESQSFWYSKEVTQPCLDKFHV